MIKPIKTKKTKLKICGVKNLETLNFLLKKRVDFIGFIFFEGSPRYINLDDAEKLINKINTKSTIAVGVFVDFPLLKIQKYIKRLKLKYIQLHGKENSNYIKTIKKNYNVKIIKAIGVKNKKDLNLINEIRGVDYFLLDYKKNKKDNLPGGNSKKFNWNLLSNFNTTKKCFLAGGIKENNIMEAISLFNPYGIDISSGVEKKLGVKSLHKISNVVDLIKRINEK